jgi:hypothetical protein
MTRRTYRTAQGKTVDLGALQLKNENIRAVGNMSVNARGDLLDSHNRPIDSRNKQVSKQYQKQVTNVQDDAVISGKKQPSVMNNIVEQQKTPATIAQSPDLSTAEESLGGLAAAIARARQVK